MGIKPDNSLRAYYNEIDPLAAEWLRNLMREGVITKGDVDERSIEDVTATDLVGYNRVHMFAGIGGWDYALNQAEWGSGEVWTGSCPCQPFSAAGKRGGFADERHLWPAWYWLIRQYRPATLFGEQVSGKSIDPWVDLVQADMEGLGYAFGCIPFPSAGVGAPHIRDRLWFVAERMADSQRAEWGPISEHRQDGLYGQDGGREEAHGEPGTCSEVRGLADADGRYAGEGRQQPGREHRQQQENGGPLPDRRTGPTNGFWRYADWLYCRDGKWRPVEPGSFPLANGVPHRVGLLRGYGNAICPQAAKVFIESYLQG